MASVGAPEGHEKWGGRQPGSQNKITVEVKKAIADALSGHKDSISEALDILKNSKPEKYLQCYEMFLQYIMPKQKEVTVHSTDGLSKEEIINQITNIFEELKSEQGTTSEPS